jgi:hypothetical protein
MFLRRRILIPLIAFAALAIWIPRQQAISQAERALEETKLQLVSLSNQVESASVERESARKSLIEQKTSSDRSLALLSAAERELASDSPEARWATPPAVLPNWNSDSPFVWVRKELVKNVNGEPFAADGSLDQQAAVVMALSNEQVSRLKQLLPPILAEYRNLESAQVKYADGHLPGITGTGEAITIEVTALPEEGAKLMAQYLSALRSVIGEQRTELLLAIDHGELEQTFGQVETASPPARISVHRHPDGSWNIAIRRLHGGSMSTSIPKGRQELFGNYIPPHLLRFFAEVIDTRE